jgi:hypothetical protein
VQNIFINGEKNYSVPSFTVLVQNLSSTIVKLEGENFNFKTLNGLYLSSSNNSMSSLELNLYTHIKSISSKFPAIYAFPIDEYILKEINVIPIQNYDITKKYDVEFRLPNNLKSGNYDIIYINSAGYSKASSSKRFTYFKVIDFL